MKKSLIKLSISSVVAVVGVTGFWVGMPVPIVEQALSQVSEEDEYKLAEAERLNQQVAELYQQGKYAEAIPLAEKALDIRRKVFDGRFHHLLVPVAESYNNLALLYKSQGRYIEAEVLYQKSLNYLRLFRYGTAASVSGIISSREEYRIYYNYVATSLNNLAGLYEEQGRFNEAEPLYERSLSFFKQELGDNHPDVATSLDNLASIYQSQGRYAKAEPLYQQSLEIRKQQLGDNHPDVATSLNNLASIYQSQGRYAEATPLYQKSLDIQNQQLGGDHPDVASSLNNLASLYQAQGNYAEALRLYQKSLAIRKKVLGEKHISIATSLNNLAELYRIQQYYSEAGSLYQKSLDIFKQNLGDDHPDVATSLHNLALLYDSQGRYSEAEPLYLRSLEILEQKLGENHPNVAKSLKSLAILYQKQGNYAKAVHFYQRYLDIVDNTQSLVPVDLLSNFNFAIQSKKQNPETIPENSRSFYLAQNSASSITDFVRPILDNEEDHLREILIFGDESQKLDFQKTLNLNTNIAISLHLQSAPNNTDALRLSLTTILRRKGRILDILTNSIQVLRQSDDPESQVLLDEFEKNRTDHSNIIFMREEERKSSENQNQQLEEIHTTGRQLEDEVSRRSHTLGNKPKLVTIEVIQQLIPTNTAFLELFRYQPFNPNKPPNEQFGKPRYAAYILYKTGEPQAIDLGAAEPIDKALEKLRKYLRNPKVPLEQLKRSARKLDKMVMQPVRELLGDTKTILLSPDAALNLIPFEALVDENNQYLVENYQITYLTSGRDLLRQNPKNNRQTPLVIANPKYQQQGEKVALENYRSIDLSDRVFLPLGGTQQEAETISKLFPEALMLTKTKATENALKQVKNPDFLHIATHGFFLSKPTSENPTDIDNPLFRSGLVFAGVEKQQSGGDDGVFTAYEATLLNLVGTQLVVLSACDTGIGDISAGEGIYGLRRAFVIAGSESQMISLWKVEDEATKDLMVAYYQGLKAGKGRRDALLEIQRDWLQEEDYQHPYYWASFIFSGDGTPIDN